MKDHVASRAIRNMLDAPGLRVAEDWSPTPPNFRVTGLDGELLMEITVAKTDGRIVVAVTDHGKRRRRGGAEAVNYWQPDTETTPLDRDGRQQIEACSSYIRSRVADYRREPEPPAPDTGALAERIRDLIAADPDNAAERIAEAVAAATDADKTAEIACALSDEPGYHG
jgi:hypothetical protein